MTSELFAQCVVAILFWGLYFVGLWGCFVKSGKPGWWALIPVVNWVLMLHTLNMVSAATNLGAYRFNPYFLVAYVHGTSLRISQMVLLTSFHSASYSLADRRLQQA